MIRIIIKNLRDFKEKRIQRKRRFIHVFETKNKVKKIKKDKLFSVFSQN